MKKKTKKLKLDGLKVNSFVTSMDDKKTDTAKGGAAQDVSLFIRCYEPTRDFQCGPTNNLCLNTRQLGCNNPPKTSDCNPGTLVFCVSTGCNSFVCDTFINC